MKLAIGTFGVIVPLQCPEHLAQSYSRYYPHTVKGEFTECLALYTLKIIFRHVRRISAGAAVSTPRSRDKFEGQFDNCMHSQWLIGGNIKLQQ